RPISPPFPYTTLFRSQNNAHSPTRETEKRGTVPQPRPHHEEPGKYYKRHQGGFGDEYSRSFHQLGGISQSGNGEIQRVFDRVSRDRKSTRLNSSHASI